MKKTIVTVTTDAEILELIEDKKIIGVLFGASWNQGTKTMEDRLDTIFESHQDFAIGYSDIEESQELALKYGIKSFPTILFFSKKGDLINSVSGVLTEKGIESKFSESLMNVGVK